MQRWCASFSLILILLIGLLIASGQTAHAYLDPGSGSYLFQLAIGAVIGGLVTLRHFWTNIKGWFTGHPRSKDHDAE